MKKILVILAITTFFASSAFGYTPAETKSVVNKTITDKIAELGKHGVNGTNKTENGVATSEVILTNKGFVSYFITTSNQSGSIENQQLYGRFLDNDKQIMRATTVSDAATGSVKINMYISFTFSKSNTNTSGGGGTHGTVATNEFEGYLVQNIDLANPPSTPSMDLYIVAADGSILTANGLNIGNSAVSSRTEYPFTTTTGETGNLVFDPNTNKISIESR